MRGLVGAPRPRGRGSGAEGGNAGDILGAGAQSALLPAAANKRLGEMDIVAASHQRADALRAADLVRRERQEIGAKRADIAGDAAGRLHRVDVQKAVGRMHDGGGLRDRLQ